MKLTRIQYDQNIKKKNELFDIVVLKNSIKELCFIYLRPSSPIKLN